MRRWQRLLWIATLVVVLVLAAVGGVGYALFGIDHQDPLRKVDAIIVLGGEHDGREHAVEVKAGLSVMEGAIRNNVPGIDAAALLERSPNGLPVTDVSAIAASIAVRSSVSTNFADQPKRWMVFDSWVTVPP